MEVKMIYTWISDSKNKKNSYYFSDLEQTLKIVTEKNGRSFVTIPDTFYHFLWFPDEDGKILKRGDFKTSGIIKYNSNLYKFSGEGFF